MKISDFFKKTFLARVSKSFKSTFLLSRFPVQLWPFCHAFPKLLYFTYFFICLFLNNFFLIFSDYPVTFSCPTLTILSCFPKIALFHLFLHFSTQEHFCVFLNFFNYLVTFSDFQQFLARVSESFKSTFFPVTFSF